MRYEGSRDSESPLFSSKPWLCSFSSVVRVFASRTLVVSIFWLRWGAKRSAIDVTIVHLSWLLCLLVSPRCVLVDYRCLFFACLKRKVWLLFFLTLIASHLRVCPQCGSFCCGCTCFSMSPPSEICFFAADLCLGSLRFPCPLVLWQLELKPW